MKKILTNIIICLLFACSKTSNPPNPSPVISPPPKSATVIGYVESISAGPRNYVIGDSCVLSTGVGYRYSDSIGSSNLPACYQLPDSSTLPGMVSLIFSSYNSQKAYVWLTMPSSYINTGIDTLRMIINDTNMVAAVKVQMTFTGNNHENGSFEASGTLLYNYSIALQTFKGPFTDSGIPFSMKCTFSNAPFK